MRPALRRGAILSRWIGPLLRTAAVRKFLMRRVRAGAAGPDDEARTRAASQLWGEAVAADGTRVQSRLQGPSGYDLTAQTAVLLAKKALSGNAPVGFQTPSRAYGADAILEVPGVVRTDVRV